MTTVEQNNGLVVFSTDRERAIFEAVKSMAGKRIIQPSFLRCEAALSSQQNQLQFYVQTTQNDVATEQKIDQNDSFTISQFQFFLIPYNPAKVGDGLPQFYPNTLAFAAQIAAGVVQADLATIWNSGKIGITVDATIFATALDTLRFWCPETTQQSTATNYSERAAAMWEPGSIVTLTGDAKTKITLNYNTWATIALAPTSGVLQVRAVIYAKGYTISGGSNLGTNASSMSRN